MAGVAVIALEGVLFQRKDNGVVSGLTTDFGPRLYRALATGYRLAVVSDRTPEDLAAHFLALEGLTSHTYFIPPVLGYTSVADTRGRQLKRLRSEGEHIELVVDTSSAVAVEALKQGLVPMILGNPLYSWGEMRPDADRALRPWAAIEEETAHQEKLRVQYPKIDGGVIEEMVE